MRRLARAVGLVLVAGLVFPAVGRAQDVPTRDVTEETERIQKSIDVLQALTDGADDDIPKYLLQRAEAIVVIPNLVKGGFVIGAKHGKGIISTRDAATGNWSAPAFMNMTGGSIGWQIGLESVDLVLLVMNKEGVSELLEDKFTIGGNLAVTAGPVGREAAAATNAQFSSQILAYSRSKGLFAGATLEGAALRAEDDDNEDLYGLELTVRDIVNGRRMPTALPPIVSTWQATMKRIAS
jgi:lipid-binding SYLF domain-containing protein